MTNPIEPKHKAIILYSMFFGELAFLDGELGKAEEIIYYLATGISFIVKKEYKVGIPSANIVTYYRAAVENTTKKNIPWDHKAVAWIIRKQVQDWESFNEVTFFPTKCFNDREGFSFQLWTIIMNVWEAAGGLTGPTEGNVLVRDHWRLLANSDIEDPPLGLTVKTEVKEEEVD